MPCENYGAKSQQTGAKRQGTGLIDRLRHYRQSIERLRLSELRNASPMDRYDFLVLASVVSFLCLSIAVVWLVVVG
jgi:hypothetical protein